MALLSDSLIAHYKMNDNLATDVIIDETGNYNGAVKDPGGTATSAFHSVAGKILRAQNFDGGDDYIDFGDIVLAGAFSISMCIYPRSLAFVTLLGDSDNRDWIRINDADTFQVRFNNINETWEPGLTFTTLEWWHLVLTRDADNLMHVYKNAVVGGVTATQIGVFTPEYIGVKSTDSYFDGLIDNVMIFDKELTPLEVKLLYNGGAGTENIPSGIQLSRTGHRFSSFPEN